MNFELDLISDGWVGRGLGGTYKFLHKIRRPQIQAQLGVLLSQGVSHHGCSFLSSETDIVPYLSEAVKFHLNVFPENVWTYNTFVWYRHAL